MRDEGQKEGKDKWREGTIYMNTQVYACCSRKKCSWLILLRRFALANSTIRESSFERV